MADPTTVANVATVSYEMFLFVSFAQEQPRQEVWRRNSQLRHSCRQGKQFLLEKRQVRKMVNLAVTVHVT